MYRVRGTVAVKKVGKNGSHRLTFSAELSCIGVPFCDPASPSLTDLLCSAAMSDSRSASVDFSSGSTNALILKVRLRKGFIANLCCRNDYGQSSWQAVTPRKNVETYCLLP